MEFFSECNNFPITDNSQGVVNIVPLTPDINNPPFLMGNVFYYFCANPAVYQLTPNQPETVCEEDGEFSQDDSPPACVQISEK